MSDKPKLPIFVFYFLFLIGINKIDEYVYANFSVDLFSFLLGKHLQVADIAKASSTL